MRVSLLKLSAWAALANYTLAKQPNILFIITDDQDGHMGSIEHMPLLKKPPTKTTFAPSPSAVLQESISGLEEQLTIQTSLM
jgi:hypothetical protein